ncbi:TPR end-of-group domain-containing protein [Psychroserpens algicola]|uniref:TPR end-of-group domain-containing protein n=1 Tax=Psychroserpens algicola TaxID=1719034 RepID=UPI001954A6DC|nr:SIR2 family protein [Psychroserpens algicola]
MEKGIHDLAYLINEAKKSGEPKPIVILGAGVSVSGGIPQASGIIKDILERFKDKPAIDNLPKNKKEDYYELMSALTSKERKKLFQDYIKKAKVNVAHIYLAQLVKKGYVDYVLTVNFDDLLLRACGLFNYTMPTYDISNIQDFTTTTFHKQSIVYLHGQHYGEWLLNAKGELDKVREQIPKLLHKICHNRTWIVVGYSGQDEVFEELNTFSSFDNDLYWVSYLDSKPNPIVDKNMLKIPTKNAHLISGYDADTFFLDLHSKLGLPTPQIFDKPFSFLKTMVDEVKFPDKDEYIEDHEDLYNSLTERMEINNNWIDRAIYSIEQEDSVEKFKQLIIEATVKEEYIDNSTKFLRKFNKPPFRDAKEELSNFFTSWGNHIIKSAKLENIDNYYKNCFDKFKRAIDINPENAFAYFSWGNILAKKARNKGNNKTSWSLYEESFEKYEKSIIFNSSYAPVYNNYAVATKDLAKMKKDKGLYEKSFKLYEKAIQLFPDNDSAYSNWAIALSEYAELIKNEKLYIECFDKFEKAFEINPKNDRVLNNWVGTNLNYLHYCTNLSEKEKRLILNESKNKAIQVYENGGNPYNLSCVYARLKKKREALIHLSESLERKFVKTDYVLNDNDWAGYMTDKDFKSLIAQF